MIAEVLFRYVAGEFDLTGWGVVMVLVVAWLIGRRGVGG